MAITWAQRLKRVFGLDIETWLACGGALRIIACIEDPAVIKKILTHLEKGRLHRTLPVAALSGATAGGSVRLNHHLPLTLTRGCDLDGCCRATFGPTLRKSSKTASAWTDSAARDVEIQADIASKPKLRPPDDLFGYSRDPDRQRLCYLYSHDKKGGLYPPFFLPACK